MVPAEKGYGFLEPEDGSPNVFCHLGAVEASGRDTMPRGGVGVCEIEPGDRGPQAPRIFSVEPLAVGHGAADRSQPLHAAYPGTQVGPPTSDVMKLPATVKLFGPAQRFGFVVPDGGGRGVFVHSSVLFRSGMTGFRQFEFRSLGLTRGYENGFGCWHYTSVDRACPAVVESDGN